MRDDRIHDAGRLMDAFAVRTGIGSAGDPARRYLWTDAYAVMAWLGLWRATGDELHLDRALRTVDLVHHHLGRHRPDDARDGWISGLGESAGRARPTAGGLRIGKMLPERAAGQPLEEHLEWRRDGQYFHYLTRWMHALHRLTVFTGDARWIRMAVALGCAAHAGFVHEHGPRGSKRIHWKMSIDLSRPLVDSMGHLDPLDGLVAFGAVRALDRHGASTLDGLDVAVADMQRICMEIPDWATADPLGLGGLLMETAQLGELSVAGEVSTDGLLPRLHRDALRGLAAFASSRRLFEPLEDRLAFRELGLALGLRALGDAPAVERYMPVVERIEETWRDPPAQALTGWGSHLDINAVMLACALVPDAVLTPVAAVANSRPGGA